MRDFKGKNAVITGAASGIGFAVASECVTRGMNLLAVDFDADKLQRAHMQLSSAAHGKVAAEVVDVTSVDALEALHERALTEFGGKVHFLVSSHRFCVNNRNNVLAKVQQRRCNGSKLNVRPT